MSSVSGDPLPPGAPKPLTKGAGPNPYSPTVPPNHYSAPLPTVGWIGLGKLGLPCALVQARAGLKVVGTDANRRVRDFLEVGAVPYLEAGVPEAFAAGVQIGWRDSVADVLADADVVFVAVQTPHAPEYEGVTPPPERRSDFEYGYLESALREIAKRAARDVTVVVVSTVLPGTSAARLRPIVDRNPAIRFVYSPAFIAMGTTMADFSDPEMVVAGTDDDTAFGHLLRVHRQVHDKPVLRLSVASCELVKVAYNVLIGQKIAAANWIAEAADATGADADEVTHALQHATDRIVSGRYMRAGMGDGGGCHPRDQIALSWLAERHGLRVDIGGWLADARVEHTRWLQSIVERWVNLTGLPARICGPEYKANTNLTIGSPSRLLAHLLFGRDDVGWQDTEPTKPAVYFVGVDHDRYRGWVWPPGSVVIDPWGIVEDQAGVVLVRPGRH